ncbi:MAG: hypothetical protein K2M82_06910, partial [Lachnospiraceae bacterium]|nr:hypothetical protein [Lachnospiraceae bacterium]
KTPNFKLNMWLESDKPTIWDFLSDNQIIDTKLGGHVKSLSMHLTEGEKLRVAEPFVFKVFQGSDEDSRTVSFNFEPSFAICFVMDNAQQKDVNGSKTVFSGISVKNVGTSGGIYIVGNNVRVKNESISGVTYKLNDSDYQYIVAAFR